MKKVLFYGAGEFAKKFIAEDTKDYEIVGVLDVQWKSKKTICGHRIYEPERVSEFACDYVIIALDDLKKGADKIIKEIYDRLVLLGVPENKIILQSFKSLEHHKNRLPRKQYLQELSRMQLERGLPGDIAECGVFRGWFASMMNEYYPEKKLWLFDTFAGFDSADVAVDTEEAKEVVLGGKFDHFNTTSEDIVRMRCMYRENLIFKKGYVPDTFQDVDAQFCFVNLDMDLYTPQLAALQFFSERMVKGGVILVHDYYNAVFTGTKKAVDEFCAKKDGMILHPIGDGLSVAILF